MRLYLRDVPLNRQAADVISRLGDEPYKWASRRGFTPEMNVDELFQELRDLFEDFDLRAEVFESLRDRKRLPGESVRDYVAVVEELVDKAVPQVSRVERSQLSTWFVLSELKQGSLVAKYDRFCELCTPSACDDGRSGGEGRPSFTGGIHPARVRPLYTRDRRPDVPYLPILFSIDTEMEPWRLARSWPREVQL